MERRMNVAEFAALVGTTAKTIYGKISNYSELPVNEQLKTVREKVKGREVTLIVTDSEQIEYYKNLYSKSPVNEGEYYETLTDNNSYKQYTESENIVKNNNSNSFASEVFDKIITVNNEYNDRLQRLTDELITSKSKMLLLEDKASREGIYINEINSLKKENNRYKLYNNLLITVIITLIIVITGYVTFSIGSTIRDESTKKEQVQNPAPAPVKK